jgi:hypothetical protein
VQSTKQFAVSARCHALPYIFRNKVATMSDDDGDYAIEVTDAGASATIPMEAGQVKKGG